MQKVSTVHYGWVVSIGCSIILFYNLGLVLNCFSVFLQPLIDSLNLSKADGSSIISVQNTAAIAMMIACGKIYKHLKVRMVSLTCGLLVSIGYLFYSFAGSLYGCYFAAVLIGFGYGAGSMVPVSILLTEWFDHSRGIAFSIATAGSGVATMLFPPILTRLIVSYGLSITFIFQATSIAILAIIAHLLIRNKPEDMHLLPYKKSLPTREEHDNSKESTHKLKRNVLRYHDAKRTSRFYQMISLAFLIGFSVPAVITHFSVLLISFDYSLVYTGYMVSIFGVFMILGKFLYGFIIDYSGNMSSSTYIFILWLIALGSVFCLHLSGLSAILFAVLVGLGSPIGSIGLSVWTEDLFGKQDYAPFYTTFAVSFNIGASFGLLLPGIVADYTGSYTTAFLIYILCTMMAFYLLYRLHKTAEVDPLNG